MSRYEARFNKTAAMQALRDFNAVSAHVEFSGGNDEGGVDHLSVTLADGTEVEPQENYTHMKHDGTKWVDVPQSTDPQRVKEGKLHDLLSAPVYERYGTFAGEFYVRGTVDFDVATGKVVYDGEEEVSRGESFHDEF